MEIKVQQPAEGINSGTVVNILVKPGDMVQKDQTVLELETEKAVAPVAAPVSGRVSAVLVEVGATVAVGQAVIRLEAEGGGAEAPKSAAPKTAASRPEKMEVPAMPKAEARPSLSEPPPGFPPPASPSLRKMAAELGIDLRRVAGSGPGGRISAADVRAYLQALQERRSPIFQSSG
jgi:pyruvate dehydrogenase E2 component (dihydrolipoamide acetyltransferase)